MEKNKKDVSKIKEEIKSLESILIKIQSDCTHTDFTIKYLQDIKAPKRVCDNCNKDLGYTNEKELKDNGFK